MQPLDTLALEDAAWRDFLQALSQHLAAEWPAMHARLGERQQSFIELAAQQALQRGISRASSVARFANLYFVWGPGFQDKPGFEWALGILAAPAERDWQLLHQLVQRSILELQRLPGALVEPQALQAADTRLLDVFGGLGRHGAMRGRDKVAPPPRVACDLEAAELRLLDEPAFQHYGVAPAGPAPGDWQRVALATPAPLRVDSARPLPARVHLLSHATGHGPQARLQVRLRCHAVCNGDVHPALAFSGPHGRWAWAGHETKAVSWAVSARPQPLPAPGPGAVIAEETAPEIQRLNMTVCGLRDEGDVLGEQQTQVWVWPAEQWWLTLSRQAAAVRSWRPARATDAPPRLGLATRCQLERDGQRLPCQHLQKGFDDGLDSAVAAALSGLAERWAQAPGMGQTNLDAALGVLVGQVQSTWGWQPAASGLDAQPWMRVVAACELDACQADLVFSGLLTLAGSQTRLRLICQGSAALRQTLRRDVPAAATGAAPQAASAPDVGSALAPARLRFSYPFVASLEPIANAQGALLQQAGPVQGALVGEAGLRPCTSGSSGWEWFALLKLEAITLPLWLTDPLLGQVSHEVVLLPEQELVAWSLA